jgi:hypothetical protein
VTHFCSGKFGFARAARVGIFRASMPTPPSQPSARSPLAGCAILITALFVLVFLIGFSVNVLFRQAGEIEKFTAKQPVPVATTPVEGNDAAVKVLTDRLEAFRAGATGDDKQPAQIELTADDLNLAIAIAPALKDLRGAFHVREIQGDKLVIDICYQMNGRPRMTRGDEKGWVTWDMQYLIGTIYGHAVLEKRELVLKVDSLVVPGAAVPEGFLEHFSTLRIFEASVKDPAIGPVMGVLTRGEIRDGKLVLARVPGESPPEVVSEKSFQEGGGRMVRILGLGACLFLIFAGIMIYIGLRKQRRDEAERETTPSSDDA